MLITTHYMDEAERCHRLAYIAYGDLLARGTLAEVVAGTPASPPGRSPVPASPLSPSPARRAGRGAGRRLRHRPPCQRPRCGRARSRASRSACPAGRAPRGRVEPGLEDVFISLMEPAERRSLQP